MIRNIKYIAVLVCVWYVQSVSAQDTHFSQYNYAPLQLNPALAGLGSCDVRFATNARTQWNTVSTSGNTYSTLNASVDMALARMTKYHSFLGLGLSLSTDVAGATLYNTNRFDLTVAYHFVMDRRANSSISAGLQFGVNHRGFDPDKSTFDSQYNPVTGLYDPTYPKETFARSQMLYLDAGVGFLYSQYFRQKRNNFFIGLSFNHVNQPNISWNSTGLFNSSGLDHLYTKIGIHGGGSFCLNNKTWVMPNFLLLFQGPSQQYNIGSLVKFKLGNSISTTYFYLGGQYRGALADAFILQTRLDYKRIMIGFSYDINVSKLVPASQTVGAPELAFMYQGCFPHKGRRLKAFPCPVM